MTSDNPNVSDVPTDESSEPLLGALDIVLLVALAAITIYWFFFKDKKKEEIQIKTYTIQPTSLPARTDISFVDKMKSSGRNVIVFYGSQTGTAEEFANRLAKEAKRYGMKGMIADPEECEMEELPNISEIENCVAIFCMATYGEGDPTDNAQEFYEWLQNGSEDLDGMNYAVFGLGNKTYEHFNAVSKYVDKRLTELGATRLYELGLGDDDGNMEEDFITWKDKFWPSVCERFGIEPSGEDILTRQYKLTVHEEYAKEKIYTGEVARLHSYQTQRPPFDPKNPYMSKVNVNRELHKGGDRSCMHIEFDIEGSRIRYDAGDHMAIFPMNNVNLVNRLGELTNTDLDTVITLTNVDEDSSKKHPFPCPTTYRTALLYYLEITSLPRTNVLKEIAEYATDEQEKSKLQLMSSNSPEGKEMYNSWIIQDVRNIIHVLEDLPSCKPPLDHLCELLPRLQARYYSIASSPKVNRTSIHITAILLEYMTPTNRKNFGVTTSWLTTKVPKDDNHPKIPIFVRKSQFRLPNKPQTPIIMVGPGTGIAPFRGFIQERAFLKNEGKPVGETLLYFGCRKKLEDFVYEEELQEFVDSGVLKMYVAFSRDQPHKIYVTHLLKEHAEDVWRIIGMEKGHLYVCGDAKNMARDVHDIIVDICQTQGKMSESDAQSYVRKLLSQKRYSQDVW